MYDVIVIGSGHNGLGVGAYLAKAGKKVLLFEARSTIGGGVVTEERGIPGFRHDTHSTSHIFIQANPLLVNDELELFSKFGLQYQYADMASAAIFADTSAVCLYHSIDKTCDSIAQFSEKDADAYRRFAALGARMLPILTMGFYTVPVPMGAFISLLEQSEDGRAFLDLMLKSPVQIADDLFEHEKVKMMFLRLVAEGTLHFPDDMGTGLAFALMPGMLHGYKFGRPIGGSGMLTQTMAAAFKHYGGELKTGCEVTKILTRGGRAVGVQTTDGEYLAKDAVVASIHPRRLSNYVDGLSESLRERAARTRPGSYSVLKIDAALNEPLRYNAPAEVTGGGMRQLIFADTLSQFLESFDCMRHGRPQLDRPVMNASNSAGNDPSRCPPGKGILYSCAMMPYRLANGGPEEWDRIKEDVADKVLEKARLLVPNLTPDNIIGRVVDSPLDIERYAPNSYIEGDTSGLGFQFFHTGGLRPLPELAQTNVPDVEGLYLCGPFMHPGGGVFGAGRPTAIKVCEDLGIDFDRVVGRV